MSYSHLIHEVPYWHTLIYWSSYINSSHLLLHHFQTGERSICTSIGCSEKFSQECLRNGFEGGMMNWLITISPFFCCRIKRQISENICVAGYFECMAVIIMANICVTFDTKFSNTGIVSKLNKSEIAQDSESEPSKFIFLIQLSRNCWTHFCFREWVLSD